MIHNAHVSKDFGSPFCIWHSVYCISNIFQEFKSLENAVHDKYNSNSVWLNIRISSNWNFACVLLIRHL